MLDELYAFDAAIAQRIDDIRAGKLVDGHRPHFLADADRLRSYSEEYAWLIALTAFPYREQADKPAIICAAQDGLFLALETYEPEKHPSFFAHADSTIHKHMCDVFGLPAGSQVVHAQDFDMAVAKTLETLVNEPKLAGARGIEDFTLNQELLLYDNGYLVEGVVRSITAYGEPMFELVPRPVSPEAKANIEEAMERRRAELEQSPTSAKLALRFAPDPEMLRLALAREPIFQMAVPKASPGFLRITTCEYPLGIIIDMDNNGIIPLDAWQRMQRDRAFMEAWLASGTMRMGSSRDELRDAILESRTVTHALTNKLSLDESAPQVRDRWDGGIDAEEALYA